MNMDGETAFSFQSSVLHDFQYFLKLLPMISGLKLIEGKKIK